MGSYEQLCTATGRYGRLRAATVGYDGTRTTVDSYVMILIEDGDQRWAAMDTYGYTWTLMERDGQLCTALYQHGELWTEMDTNGRLCAGLRKYTATGSQRQLHTGIHRCDHVLGSYE